jgi:hypothetical protein
VAGRTLGRERGAASPQASASRSWPSGSSAWRPACRHHGAGCGPPAERSGDSRRRRGRPRSALSFRSLGSSGGIPAVSTDECAGAAAPELPGLECVVAGEVGDPAGRPTRRNRCIAPDFRSKWRKTGGSESLSGYHAGSHLTIPMLGRTPARNRVTHRIAFSPQDRASGPRAGQHSARDFVTSARYIETDQLNPDTRRRKTRANEC